jgi:hypothetical protein
MCMTDQLGFTFDLAMADGPREIPMARNADKWTSHEAARRAKTHSSVGRLLVLRELLHGPRNDFELAAATGWQQTSIGKRRLECARQGWVEAYRKDGEQVSRKSPSGSASLVWAITAAGRAVLG